MGPASTSALFRKVTMLSFSVIAFGFLLAELIFVSCENGQIYCGDTRHPGRPSFSMHVGRSAVAAVGLSMHASGCLVAASDQTLTVWDVSGAAPALVATRELPAVVRFVNSLTIFLPLTFSCHLGLRMPHLTFSGIAVHFDVLP